MCTKLHLKKKPKQLFISWCVSIIHDRNGKEKTWESAWKKNPTKKKNHGKNLRQEKIASIENSTSTKTYSSPSFSLFFHVFWPTFSYFFSSRISWFFLYIWKQIHETISICFWWFLQKSFAVVPPWVIVMYNTMFFSKCVSHPNAKKNELDRFCIDCLQSFCSHCFSAHAFHKHVKVIFSLFFFFHV